MQRKETLKEISKKEKKEKSMNIAKHEKEKDGRKIKEEKREKILMVHKCGMIQWLLEIKDIFCHHCNFNLVSQTALNISILFSEMTGFDIYLLNTKTTVRKRNHHSAENYTPYLRGVHKIRATSSKGSALKHSVFQNDYLNHIYSYANSTFPFMLFSGCFSN